jgi:hypothetical protein
MSFQNEEKYKHSFYIFFNEFLKIAPPSKIQFDHLMKNSISIVNESQGSNKSVENLFISFFIHVFNHHADLKNRFIQIISSVGDAEQLFSDKIRVAEWHDRDFSPPVPHSVKRKCLFRNRIENAIWIETGTALGDMTRFLSSFAKKVYSIEPFREMYDIASLNCKHFSNIELLYGTSESFFPELIPKLSGDVCFFLDGHFSGDGTFQGETDTPIVQELFYISNNIRKFRSIMVAIDDLRCFYPTGDDAYPSLGYVIEWAESNKLVWHIEHDMFIAKSIDSKFS